MYKCKHFKIQELVSKQVFEKYGEKAWEFFDDRFLKTIDWLRDVLQKPILINTWHQKGISQQQGFRSNLERFVVNKTEEGALYCTQHMFGRAADMEIMGMTADEFRKWAVKNADQFPYPVWIEDNVSWVHIDTRQSDKQKVYLFKP